MKDDSLYIVAIVAVVAVVGLVIMATGSSTTVVAQESLPDMVESDSSAIAGQAYSSRGTGDAQRRLLEIERENNWGIDTGVGRTGPGKETTGTDSSDEEGTNTDDGDTTDETTTSVHSEGCPPGVIC